MDASIIREKVVEAIESKNLKFRSSDSIAWTSEEEMNIDDKIGLVVDNVREIMHDLYNIDTDVMYKTKDDTLSDAVQLAVSDDHFFDV